MTAEPTKVPRLDIKDTKIIRQPSFLNSAKSRAIDKPAKVNIGVMINNVLILPVNDKIYFAHGHHGEVINIAIKETMQTDGIFPLNKKYIQSPIIEIITRSKHPTTIVNDT